MSDNPKKKKLDGKRISQQPWEQAYQRRKNAGKKKEVVASFKVSQKDPNNDPVIGRVSPISSKWLSVIVVDRRKLESVLSIVQNAVLQNPIRSKGPINFCKEWEEKGKPIFNLVLVLFTFSPRVKATIKRIMNGIDGVCAIPQPVVEP